MTKPNNDDINIYDLISRADELLSEEEEDILLREEDEEDYMGGSPEPEIHIVYEEPVDMDATIVYRNAANNYGRIIYPEVNSQQPVIRNAANNYGMDQIPPYQQPAPSAQPVPPAAPMVKPAQAAPSAYTPAPDYTPAPARTAPPAHTAPSAYPAAPMPEPEPAPAPAPKAKPAPAAKPTMAEKAANSIRAYNADFRTDRDRPAPKASKKAASSQEETTYIPNISESDEPDMPETKEKPKKVKTPRKRGCLTGCLTRLVIFGVIIAMMVGLFNFFVRPPETDSPLAERRKGVTTILLCGADIGGDRTDTMMLLYVDADKKQAGLLSLPRDTYTISAYGESYKLNSAYGRNGGGREGMEVLFDYVQKIIGFRPDGYMLIELPMLRDLVDLMGGVEFNVPQDMSAVGVSLQAGLQHLTGEQALGLIRHRYGYANQDLGRQDVQKDFLKACLDQWVSPENLSKIKDALALVNAQSFTNLSTGNFAWLGINLLRCGFSKIYTDTLPGYSTMIGDQSYYVLYPSEVATMIQQRYNPYNVKITSEMLDIATE